MTIPLIFVLRFLFITCFLLSAKERLKLGPTEIEIQRVEIGQKGFGIIWYIQLISGNMIEKWHMQFLTIRI